MSIDPEKIEATNQKGETDKEEELHLRNLIGKSEREDTLHPLPLNLINEEKDADPLLLPLHHPLNQGQLHQSQNLRKSLQIWKVTSTQKRGEQLIRKNDVIKG